MMRAMVLLLAMAGCEEPRPTDGEIPFHLVPREPVPELRADQDRHIMLVVDVSASMGGLRSMHHAGILTYLSALTRPGDQLGISMFAEQVATEDGATYTATSVPWIPLTDVSGDLTSFRERLGTVCPACDGDSDNDPTLPRMRGCTNPAVGIAQAASTLALQTPDSDFRGMVVISGHGFNCGSELPGALAAADEAYDEHDIHVWTIQPEFLGVQMNQVPYLTRGAGFFQYTTDALEVPSLYGVAAGGLPRDGR